MNWRAHTEPPAQLPIVALIALRDPEDGEYFLLGIHTQTAHHRGVWVDEDTGRQLTATEYWWLPEAELLAPFSAGAYNHNGGFPR